MGLSVLTWKSGQIRPKIGCETLFEKDGLSLKKMRFVCAERIRPNPAKFGTVLEG